MTLTAILAPRLRGIPHPADAHSKRVLHIHPEDDLIIIEVTARKYSMEVTISAKELVIKVGVHIKANSYLAEQAAVKDFNIKARSLSVNLDHENSMVRLAEFLEGFGVVIVPEGMEVEDAADF